MYQFRYLCILPANLFHKKNNNLQPLKKAKRIRIKKACTDGLIQRSGINSQLNKK
jgi:hypothetical protein